MTTPHKHADLIHAFADGKILQYMDKDRWIDWAHDYCPNTVHCTVRIKPGVAKKVKLECWLHRNTGALMYRYEGADQPEYFVRLPELDREITLPGDE